MSVKAVAWAFEQKVGDPGAKVLLLALADFANDENVTWHRRGTLAERVEVSERTVSRYVQHLVDKGLITVEQRRLDNGANSTNFYRLHLEQQALLLPAGQIVSGVRREPRGVSAPGTSGVSTPETRGVSTIEPSVEPSTKPSLLGSGLPDFIPADAWNDFIADRKERKKALTTRAMKMAMQDLAELHAQGHDLRKVLEQSIRKGWSTLYAPRDSQPAGRATHDDVASEAARLIERGQP